MSTFDLVIFDLDGVLIDSEVLSCGSLAETLTLHGVPISIEEVMDRFLGRSFTEVMAFYERCKSVPMGEAFQRQHRSLLLRRFDESLQAMPGAASVLAGLPVPFCLASSSDPERIRLSLGRVGLGAVFGDRIFCSAMVARGKPAPDLFLLAAQRLGAEPARTLVIEDSPTGVAAGLAAGMTVWGFVGGSHYATRDGRTLLREAGASRIVESLAEIVPERAGELTQ